MKSLICVSGEWAAVSASNGAQRARSLIWLDDCQSRRH